MPDDATELLVKFDMEGMIMMKNNMVMKKIVKVVSSVLMIAGICMGTLFSGYGETASVKTAKAANVNVVSPFKVIDIRTGYYQIASAGNSNAVLGVSNGSLNGSDITLQSRNPLQTNQIIFVKRCSDSGLYTLKLLHSGKYIAITDLGNGQRIWQSSTPTKYYIYCYKGYYYFYSPDYNKVIDVYSGNCSVGNRVWSYQKNLSTAQLFSMKGVSAPSPKYTVSNLKANNNKGTCTVSMNIKCSNYPILSIYGVWNNSRTKTYAVNSKSVNFNVVNSGCISGRTYRLQVYCTTGKETSLMQTVNVRIP